MSKSSYELEKRTILNTQLQCEYDKLNWFKVTYPYITSQNDLYTRDIPFNEVFVDGRWVGGWVPQSGNWLTIIFLLSDKIKRSVLLMIF